MSAMAQIKQLKDGLRDILKLPKGDYSMLSANSAHWMAEALLVSVEALERIADDRIELPENFGIQFSHEAIEALQQIQLITPKT